jgi:hypothetical protein
MNFTSIVVWYKSTAAALDGVFAIGSLLMVPIITIAPIAWLSEGHSHMKSNLRATSVEGRQHIVGDLQFERKPIKVSYSLELVDPKTGETMVFPAVETKGVPKFDNTLLPVPKTLRPGQYQLRANVHYVTNPLTAQNEVVEVSTIVVN